MTVDREVAKGPSATSLLLFCVLLPACTSTGWGGHGQALQWHGRIYAGEQHGSSREPVSFANATMTRLATGLARVTITLHGGLIEEPYTWQIRVGTCGSNGPIVGSPDDYGVLRIDPRGLSLATVDLDVALDPVQSYHINLHRADMGIVACGDLTRPPARPRRTRPLRADPVLG